MWTDRENYVPSDDDYLNATVVLPDNAYAPSPADGAIDAPIDLVLNWMAGDSTSLTNGHKLYFSESVDDVTNGVGAITLTPSTYEVPNRLEFAKTYYWRVDEITSDGTVLEGSLWSFTTELFSYPVLNVTATASSSAVDKGPENVVDGSGLDSTGMLHANQGPGTMWLSNVAGQQPTWILFEFDNVYKLYEMLVWNSNESLEPEIGLGFKEVLIEYSRNGVDFMTLGTTHEFARGTGSVDYAHNTTIDMAGVGAKFVRLTANSNWADILPQFGLSEVRFLSIPVQAGQPVPSSETFDVALDLDLAWRKGREADKHNVYFSDDLQAVVDGTAPVISLQEPSHGPLSLDLGKTYFWRVDEVNDTETPSTWPGEVWNFTTIKSLIIDDFEAYNDIPAGEKGSNLIYEAWIDGFSDPAKGGSQVGYLDIPSYEDTIVLSGNQSMPMFYDNAVGNSEATLTLTDTRDWTVHGINRLTIWFRGEPNNVAENLYFALNSSAVVNHDNPDAALETTWTPWNIDLTRFADQGVNLKNVDSISIGIGDKTNPQSGGSGVMYFDNIGLYPELQTPVQKQTNSVFEAEDADLIGAGWRTYLDETSLGGTHIGSNVGDGSYTNAAPGADWILRYSFTAEAGVYKIVARVIAPTIDDDSFWVRILDAESQTHEHPGQLGTGWVRFNDIAPGSQGIWDEVHSSDHGGEVVNWTLAAGNYTLEIAKREDGASIDAILITDDLALDPATLP
jgi:hypothetical protein